MCKTGFILAGFVLVLATTFPSLQGQSTGGEIASGETKTGNISTNGQMDSYFFQGSDNQVAIIEMAAAEASDLGPSIYLYAPNGSLETKLIGTLNSNRVRLESYQLKQSGTYTIVTAASWADYTSNTGQYGLSFLLLGDGVEPPAIPGANFSANMTRVPLDAIVSFADLSTGEVESWLWDFGDGQTSSEQNPTHIYTKSGNYTVTLTVSNQAGSDTAAKTVPVRSYLKPQPEFTPSRG